MEFLSGIADCTFPADKFHHGDHLRLAWLLLHSLPYDDAVTRMRHLIGELGSFHGKSQLYNETLTRGWMILLSSHREQSFEQFLHLHGHRVSKVLLYEYWTPALWRAPRRGRAGFRRIESRFPTLRVTPVANRSRRAR